ncbi:glycosyltransferase [Vibrio astriarenae]
MKVLHVVGGLDFGGIEKWLSNIFKYSNGEVSNFVFSLHPTKREIVPFLNLPLNNIYFTNKNNTVGRIATFIKVLSKIKPDVVHCHAGYSSGIYSLISRLFGVKKIVVHSHSDRRNVDNNVSFLKRQYIFVMKLLLSKLDVTRVAVSKGSGESLFNAQYEIMYCGVDTEINPVNIPQLNDFESKGKKFIFHIGRYTEAKNFPFILEILKSFKGHRDYIFVFISGELDDFKKLCFDNGIQNVVFLGQVDNPSSIMSRYDGVFILPSKWEGLPLSAVEAQCCGLNCVISSNVTKEVDIGLTRYADLSLDDWHASISESFNTNNSIDENKSKMFSITSNVRSLESLYTRH